MILLDKQVSIIMMKRDNDGNNLKELNKNAKYLLSVAFGGVTISNGAGTWVDGDQLYEDKNYIFSCNYSDKLTDKQKNALLKVLKMEFNEGGQLAVSILFNSSLAILEKDDLKEKTSLFIEK